MVHPGAINKNLVPVKRDVRIVPQNNVIITSPKGIGTNTTDLTDVIGILASVVKGLTPGPKFLSTY